MVRYYGPAPSCPPQAAGLIECARSAIGNLCVWKCRPSCWALAELVHPTQAQIMRTSQKLTDGILKPPSSIMDL